MVWPFSKKQKNTKQSLKMPFKSGEALLEYQCKFGHTDIQPEHGIVAVVLDSIRMFGAKDSVKIEDDGRQTAMLKVASEDGGFVVPAQTLSDKGDRLKPDDVVIWVPMNYVKETVPEDTDARFGWVGFIVAKVKPEIDMANPNFDILCDYSK